MLKVSELRLGNLISHNGSVMPVVQIERRFKTIFRLNDMDVDERIIEDHFQPISLTPEWLERCGFVEDRCGWTLPGTQFSLTDKYYPCWLDRMLWPQDMPDFKHLSLQYVHQLQNLYFALTGQELAITQPVS